MAATNPAHSASSSTDPFHVDVTPPSPEHQARLTEDEAEQIVLRYPKVKAWLKRYPAHPTIDASYSKGTWTINVFSGKAGEVVTATVDDVTGSVLSAWTGPQVAWGMARGGTVRSAGR